MSCVNKLAVQIFIMQIGVNVKNFSKKLGILCGGCSFCKKAGAVVQKPDH